MRTAIARGNRRGRGGNFDGTVSQRVDFLITLTGGGGRLLNVAPWTQFFDLQGRAGSACTVSGVTQRKVRGEVRPMGTLRGTVRLRQQVAGDQPGEGGGRRSDFRECQSAVGAPPPGSGRRGAGPDEPPRPNAQKLD